ncbi:DNA mismatch repair protein MutS [Aciduricibacillus chroicocephali]|uniref:DNA mismatch repair protein MutS n=1 Tax=Aciduricibacillus chroicocephali TaxID=3054939 RepID=A0ABY9KYE1_9BACI|nr:DNA mismatch repair protein MutS [Bacillaceae bacterium 44XB]
MAKLTPMMEQYLSIKAAYKDAFLFFRLGDFYEMFFEDAIKAAKELEITLTKRDGNKENPIPMCGVPYHSAPGYIKILIEKGYKVAICEQVEDPKTAKGVVKREVIQLITPGTVMESGMLHDRDHNYIASLSELPGDNFGIVYNDLSTGESTVAIIEGGHEAVIHELYSQPVKEIVVDPDLSEEIRLMLVQQLDITLSTESCTDFREDCRDLYDHLPDEKHRVTFSRMLHYVYRTQKRSLDHMQPAEVIDLQEHLILDKYSKRNLELTETILKKEKYGSLLWVLDQTETAMGARLLKKWIERPLLQEFKIKERHDIVESFIGDFMKRDELRELLDSVYDLERLAGRVAFGNANARDLLQLKQSLQKLPAFRDLLMSFENSHINQKLNRMPDLSDLVSYLEASITEDPPISVKEGGMIKDGFNEQLDTYRDASKNGKSWIASLEKEEKDATGVRSLKIGYNRIFGYYIEVTKANLHMLPEGRYERKQTLANAERFITPELKEKEQLILEAEEKSTELEYELFMKIRDHVKNSIQYIQFAARTIAEMDVLQSFAEVSEKNSYVRPVFSRGKLTIRQGRHPVIEQVMKTSAFVPNDVELDEDRSFLLITGPNMSGKSTYMRQLALTIIMGQIGCFVPADHAELLIFDQIFTRIGAADDLVAGQSTFMVEMLETNHAISCATSNSLILLDEIGRGTSTYDGMALAQAIAEYIHNHIGAKTLFSTHYHELTSLEKTLPNLKNIHVRAEEHDDEIVFLHQICDGAADESYGIHVAKLAKMPPKLIERSREILNDLENGTPKQTSADISKVSEPSTDQLSFFAIQEPAQDKKEQIKDEEPTVVERELASMDLFEMTPLDAMNALYKLKKLAKK